MRFDWRHAEERLWGALSAPAPGWLAVGFNTEPTLRGTRFVIAAVAEDGAVRAEEHVAQVPDHVPVEALGGISDLRHVEGRRMGDRSEIAFSLPHRSSDGLAPPLGPGIATHLMLAWSPEADFTHHSAWRGHFDVLL